MPISRNVTIKDVFAKNASTTIPATPVTGTSYRNTSVSTTNIKKGWPFKTIVDSSNFNEILYELSSICKAIEDYGFLPWSNLTNYVVNSVCLGSNGKIYQATQASGPSSAAKDPTSTTGYWTEFGIDKFVTLATEQTLTSSKLFKATQYIGTGSVTKGTAPASSTYYGLYFVDKNGTDLAANQLGQLQMVCDANGENRLALNVIKQTANSTEAASIRVGIAQDGTKYTSAPVPTEDTTSSTQIDTVGARNTKLGSYALDSDVMHLTGNESASGYKTFTNNIIRKGSWTAGTPGSGNQTSYIQFADSTGTVYGSIGKFYGSGGTFRTEMTGKKTDGTGEISISIGYDASGNPRALAPTPDTTTQTTSTQIATTGWVNSVGNNVMHLTGDESISGNKTFSGTIISTNKGSSPPINVLAVKTARGNGNFSDLIGLYDTANNCRCATIRAFNTAAEHSLLLGVNNFNDGAPQGINIAYDSSNNLTITGKTPSSATDNSTQLATTAWVNNWVSANGGFSSFSKSQNGYLKLGNGVIIQWGRNEVTASGGQTITLPTAFTNSNYKVVSAMESSDGYSQLGITARTTTNFTFNPNWAGTYAWIAIGY